MSISFIENGLRNLKVLRMNRLCLRLKTKKNCRYFLVFFSFRLSNPQPLLDSFEPYRAPKWKRMFSAQQKRVRVAKSACRDIGFNENVAKGKADRKLTHLKDVANAKARAKAKVSLHVVNLITCHLSPHSRVYNRIGTRLLSIILSSS